jgi:molybdopterin-guanine dinucleotide biosynthesis protein A
MKIAGLCISPGHNFFGHHGRPAGEHPLLSVEEVDCVAHRGLRHDRFFDHKPDYHGQVTFFALETHEALCRELDLSPVSAALYRRNVLTRGSDLGALIGREFVVQGVSFLGTAECTPCHWMDQSVGPGAAAWLRGRGGLRAKILGDGRLQLDDCDSAGVLLVGGHSRRMGRDKAGLPWAGRPLADHQAARLAASGAWPLLCSCRAEQRATPIGFTRVEDEPGRAGPLSALIGTWAATKSEVLTCLAVDLPLVPTALLAFLAREARTRGVSIVPRLHGRYQPLAAAWHRSALPVLVEAAENERSFQHVCSQLEVTGRLCARQITDEEAGWFLNLNTAADIAPNA